MAFNVLNKIFTATSAIDHFNNPSEVLPFTKFPASFNFDIINPADLGKNGLLDDLVAAGLVVPQVDLSNGTIENIDLPSPILVDTIPNVQYRSGTTITLTVFADTGVNYSFSSGAIDVDLNKASQSGGFAEGDTLGAVSEVIGSSHNDVIRGSSPQDFSPPDSIVLAVNGVATGTSYSFTVSNPGLNTLVGGDGSDVLEGRGGADVLIGGTFTSDFALDFASYESSPAAVTVTLGGVGSDTQPAIASGGDATGDTLVGIEGLIGSRFADKLTGNSLNNVLSGGLGYDTLDGKGGIDTADYSNDHFYDNAGTRIFENGTSHDAPDMVEVTLGLNGADGTASKFVQLNPNIFRADGTDTLRSIENIIGTHGDDEVTGNEVDNVLNGGDGNDFLDGGLGNDRLIGGAGINTAVFTSHDGISVNPLLSINTITLGLNGADGSFVRSHIVLGLPVHTQVDETDVLQDFRNVIGSNLSETINGNEQNNALSGRAGNDIINGGAGNDILLGGTGNDTLNGGADNDTYDYSGDSFTNPGSDTLFDESGIDRVKVNALSDVASALRDGNDLVVLFANGNGNFRIVDHFNGHPIENLVGGGQTVTLSTSTVGGNGPGIIAGTNGNDTLDGKGGDDFLYGNGGDDLLLGGDGNDRLDGGSGNDVLKGEDGDDTLIGGPGHDLLIGGAGHDTFVFAPTLSEPGLANATGVGGAIQAAFNHWGRGSGGIGKDVIADFVRGEDVIDLTAYHTTFQALTEQGYDHQATPVEMHTAGHDTVLEFVGGGSALISGVTHLHASDFLL